MEPISGFFSDGLSAKQYACTISIQDNALHLKVEGYAYPELVWEMAQIVNCQINANRLIIKYGSYPHLTLECSGPEVHAIYERWAAGKPIQRAEGIVYKGRTRLALGLTALFIGVLLFCYFILLPWAGEKAAAIVPRETEVEMGNSIADVFTSNYNIQDSATILANAFLSKLQTGSDYNVTLTVLESEDINAFAVPGGKIFIYSGIIEGMESYEELVALIGHELTHVEKQHSLKSICRSIASGLVITTMFGDITGISSAVVAQADQFKQLSYSRELEMEADNTGFDWMLKNRVNPIGMRDLLTMLKEEGHKMPGMMKYLSTHPETQARIDNVEQRRKTLKGQFEDNAELRRLFDLLKKKAED